MEENCHELETIPFGLLQLDKKQTKKQNKTREYWSLGHRLHACFNFLIWNIFKRWSLPIQHMHTYYLLPKTRFQGGEIVQSIQQ